MTDLPLPPSCSRCHVRLSGTAYEGRAASGDRELRCFRCALSQPRLLRRSLAIALIVGTLLVAINQGNVILGGDFPVSLYWKLPLTYCVPFAVATTGALLNSRTDVS